MSHSVLIASAKSTAPSHSFGEIDRACARVLIADGMVGSRQYAAQKIGGCWRQIVEWLCDLAALKSSLAQGDAHEIRRLCVSGCGLVEQQLYRGTGMRLRDAAAADCRAASPTEAKR